MMIITIIRAIITSIIIIIIIEGTYSSQMATLFLISLTHIYQITYLLGNSTEFES